MNCDRHSLQKNVCIYIKLISFYLHRAKVNMCGMTAGCSLTLTGHQTSRSWTVVVFYSIRMAPGQPKTVEMRIISSVNKLMVSDCRIN